MGRIKSCTECRRLKLKCTRDGEGWPCVPCRRRRCEELCPEGSGGNTEKASSERLLRHYRTRIASLETELESSREQIRQTCNGLERRSTNLTEQTPISNTSEGHFESVDEANVNSFLFESNQSPSIVYSSDGLLANQQYYHGRSTGSFFAHPSNDGGGQPRPNKTAVQRATAALAGIPLDQAMELLVLYSESVTWMYSPISSADIHRFTRRAYESNLNAGEMGVVCFALALGNHFQRATNPDAKEFHPLLYNIGIECLLNQETFTRPTLEAAAAAHLCTSYLLSQGESGKSQAAWQMLGIGIRLAVSMGLHCHQEQWGADQDRSQACSLAFWELQVYERLQSLNFGRPGLLPQVITCQRPMVDNLFYSIKYDLCDLYEKINLLLSQRQLPDHLVVMRIDGEVRAFEASIPPLLDLQKPLPETWEPELIPQRHMLSLLIHKALLFLHRPWFARALLQADEPLFSPLANSFAAAVKSARQHTKLYESILKSNPMISSWWFFVFHLFTAAVVQAQVLIRSTNSLLAAQCQDDFELSHSLLGKASRYSKIAARSVNLLSGVRSEILFDIATQASRPRNNFALLAATAIADGEQYSSRPTELTRGASIGETTSTSAGESSSALTAEATPQDDATMANNFSDIFAADVLPPEFLNQSEWMEMDPLMQAAVYWHPHCATK